MRGEFAEDPVARLDGVRTELNHKGLCLELTLHRAEPVVQTFMEIEFHDLCELRIADHMRSPFLGSARLL